MADKSKQLIWLNAWRVEAERWQRRFRPNAKMRVNDQSLLSYIRQFNTQIDPDLVPGQSPFWHPDELVYADTRWITKEQWERISAVSGLPAEARGDVQNFIIAYRTHRRRAPAVMKHELEMCADKIMTAIEYIEKIQYAWPDLSHHGDGWSMDRIDRFENEAARFVIRIDGASGGFGRGRRGPNKGAKLHLLVSRLAETLLKFTGQYLSLSKKGYGPEKRRNVAKYIYESCKTADPNLADKTIRNVLLEVKRRQRRA